MSQYKIKDKVKLKNDDLVGWIVWMGTVDGKGKKIGIELDQWSELGGDGSVNGKFYFKARGPGWGYFTTENKISSILSRGKGRPKLSSSPRANPGPSIQVPAVQRIDQGGIAIGDVVQLRNGKKGEIMYIGKVKFAASEVIGLKLSNWSEKGHDGEVKGTRYYTCRPGYGYFTKRKAIVQVLQRPGAQPVFEAPKEDLTPVFTPPTENDDNGKVVVDFNIGDKVRLNRGRVGVVKFKGSVSFSNDIVVGLELDNWYEKGHDGAVKGKRYFTCSSGRGYFTKAANVTDVLEKAAFKDSGPKVAETPRSIEDTSSPKTDEPLVDIAIGDVVRLRKGREGTVRYIGAVDHLKGEVVGLELKQWHDRGHNGTHGEKKYFSCKNGTGYWTTRGAIVDVIQKGSIMQDFKEYKDPEPVSSPRQEEQLTAGKDIGIGDEVRLRKGREGTVRFIGEVTGLKGEVVGLELKQWHDKGHNGDLNGKKYFNCKEGTGYWTKRTAIAEITKKYRSSQRIMSTSSLSELTKSDSKEDVNFIDCGVGDSVRLKRGREGTIRYIGKQRNAKDNVIVGLELTQWSADGGDGMLKDKRYFTCDKGRAYFTRLSSVAVVLEKAKEMEKKIETVTESVDDGNDFLEEMPGTSFQIGDRVRLQRGRVGTVKFFGMTEFSKEVVVGLELEQWSDKGNDGSVKGVRYFQTRGPGWGYFTKPDSIAEVLIVP